MLILFIVDDLRQKIEIRKRLPLLVFNITPLVAGLFAMFFVGYSVVYVAAMMYGDLPIRRRRFPLLKPPGSI